MSAAERHNKDTSYNLPRSSSETLLDFWLEVGSVSLRRVYPSRSSSRLLCSDSMRCFLMVSRRL